MKWLKLEVVLFVERISNQVLEACMSAEMVLFYTSALVNAVKQNLSLKGILANLNGQNSTRRANFPFPLLNISLFKF